MQTNYHKFAGRILCGASVLLLIILGKLDLIIVLLPLSLLLGYVISAPTHDKDYADELHRKGVA